MKGAMPKLEYLHVPFDVSVAKTSGYYLGIENLTCLKHADVFLLLGEVATPSEGKAAVAAIRNEAAAHPNHPMVNFFNEPDEEDNEGACGDEYHHQVQKHCKWAAVLFAWIGTDGS